MDKSIRAVFEDVCGQLKIDARLVKKIRAYQVGFVNKNQDHSQFFGGNLTGVQVVRFTDDDRNRWFQDILEVDDEALRARLHALPTVNENFHISSDAMNLSCAWLLHALDSSSHVSPSQAHDAKVDVLLILQYKFLTSLLWHYFHHVAEREIAEATYAQLTYKFALKAHGSWGALLRARAEDVLDKDSIHIETIQQMDSDDGVVYMLNDTQSRVRDTLKNIYAVMMQIKQSGHRHVLTSSIVEHDGVEILKDRTRSLERYTRYIRSVITDEPSFIREELAEIIEKLMYTMSPTLFRQTLKWMSENYTSRAGNEIGEILDGILVHSFDYLSDHRSVIKERDLAGMLSKLRGVYTSSRSTDPELFKLREGVEKLVTRATGNKNDSTIAAVRTGVLLYVVLRSFTMRHYTQKGN